MTPAPTTAATATTTTALTTVEILHASGVGAGALIRGRSRTLGTPLATGLGEVAGTLETALATIGGTLRTALVAVGGTLRTPLTRALVATLTASFRSATRRARGGRHRRAPPLVALSLVAPVARSIAPLPAAPVARATRACPALAIAAVTPRSTPAPLVVVHEGRTAGAPHHPHPVGARPDAEEATRAFLKDGDHHFGAGEAQRTQPLLHRRVQRLAFENVAQVGHRSPLSYASRPGGKANPEMPALALQANHE